MPASTAPRFSVVHLPPAEAQPASLLDFLAARFPRVGRELWLERFSRGLVQDAAGRPLDAAAPCRAHLELRYFREVAAEPDFGRPAMLFVDRELVVADKPPFQPVIPSGPWCAARCSTSSPPRSKWKGKRPPSWRRYTGSTAPPRVWWFSPAGRPPAASTPAFRRPPGGQALPGLGRARHRGRPPERTGGCAAGSWRASPSSACARWRGSPTPKANIELLEMVEQEGRRPRPFRAAPADRQNTSCGCTWRASVFPSWATASIRAAAPRSAGRARGRCACGPRASPSAIR